MLLSKTLPAHYRWPYIYHIYQSANKVYRPEPLQGIAKTVLVHEKNQYRQDLYLQEWLKAIDGTVETLFIQVTHQQLLETSCTALWMKALLRSLEPDSYQA